MLPYRYIVTTTLLLLLGMLQYQIWTGRASVQQVNSMRMALNKQRATNAQTEAAIAQLQVEITDLKDGLDTVEEKARLEFGMVKSNEIFVQIVH